jgi:hypothetical protein
VYAFSCITQPLCQYGLDLLIVAWNAHGMARTRKMEGTGGVPNVRMTQHPHPGGQLQIPAGLDAVQVYERARHSTGRQPSLRQVPEHVPRCDPLFCHPHLQQQRSVCVERILGRDVCAVWVELQAGAFGRIMEAYRCFLSCR